MKEIGTTTLQTDRLYLRKFAASDAEGMYRNWASDEKVSQYVSWSSHKCVEETASIISNWMKEYNENSYNWVVERKDTHELIGNIVVINMNKEHNYCEVGYCYGSKFWNHGYATEALTAVLNYLLNDCEIHIVEAKHWSYNTASGKVMKKAGMIKESVLKERRYNKMTDSYDDLISYYKKK